jgi:hypothetical protein
MCSGSSFTRYEAVRLAEKAREVPGDGLGSGLESQDPLEVRRAIRAVGDLAAVAIQFALTRSPTGGVRRGYDAMDPVGRKEAVLDSLTQTL